MKAHQLLLFFIFFPLCGNVSAQNKRGSVCGNYSVLHVIQPIQTPDTLESIGWPVRVYPVVFIEFDGSHTLKLKMNRRFKLTSFRAIKDYGLNKDNPTIYGTYKVKNDTLILEYHYMIQHFNNLAPKSREKTHFNNGKKSHPERRFARMENGDFKISSYGFWQRIQ